MKVCATGLFFGTCTSNRTVWTCVELSSVVLHAVVHVAAVVCVCCRS
jgi:hypothetical protein